MEVRRRKGESISAFLYRFQKRVQQSGILREAKKRKYRDRPISKLKKRLSALHREQKKKEIEKMTKMGTI